jgi:ABC-type sugar transport system ATPase subunit
MDAANDIILDMRSITKSFPGVRALDGVDFSCRKGTVHALVGENGAGKSTLIKILAGVYQPDSGEIVLKGQHVSFGEPHHALKGGVSVIYQESNLTPYLDAAQNIFLGREPHGRFGLLRERHTYEQAAQLIKRLGVTVDLKVPVYMLSVAHRQTVDIAKALSYQSDILVMDEPTSSLSLDEVAHLFTIIKSLKEHGVTIIYISHRLDEIFDVADVVTVLKDGKTMGTMDIAQATKSRLIELMVGRPLSEAFPPRARTRSDEVILRASNLSRRGFLEDVSFEVHMGEIVGVTGLDGSGRRELGRAVCGVEPPDSGQVYVCDSQNRCRSPRDTINAGMAFVSDDRKQEGLVLGMSVQKNVSLPTLGQRLRMLLIDSAREKQEVSEALESVRMSCDLVGREAQFLSGGTQQKTVLAKWLLSKPKLIVLDEPTRGIDVGAKIEIYQLIRQLANQGAAILMLSSELYEIIGMSDRILVMHGGHIVAECQGAEATEQSLITAAVGGEGEVGERDAIDTPVIAVR